MANFATFVSKTLIIIMERSLWRHQWPGLVKKTSMMEISLYNKEHVST